LQGSDPNRHKTKVNLAKSVLKFLNQEILKFCLKVRGSACFNWCPCEPWTLDMKMVGISSSSKSQQYRTLSFFGAQGITFWVELNALAFGGVRSYAEARYILEAFVFKLGSNSHTQQSSCEFKF
jgi:hypothetical protein